MRFSMITPMMFVATLAALGAGCTRTNTNHTATGTGATATGSGGGSSSGSGSGPIVCRTIADCPADSNCVGGRCYQNTAATCGVLALAQCASANDAACGTGKKCVAGQCETMCTSGCGSGSVCHQGLCEATPQFVCTFDGDCGAGARCINANCFTTCTSDSQCSSEDHCVRGTCRSK